MGDLDSDAKKSVHDPKAGRTKTWSEVQGVHDGIVYYETVDKGEELVALGKLRFCTKDELIRSLADAGFTVERVYGDWDRRSAGPQTRELILKLAPVKRALIG
jgi:hypothetical protein